MKLGVLGLWFSLVAFASPATDTERLVRIEHMYASYRAAFPGVADITAADLRKTLSEGGDLVLVDVRPAVERDVSTLPGSITLRQLREGADTYRSRKVVVFCTVGARSGWEARGLKKDGFDVVNLRGSLLAWTHAAGPLVDAAGASTRRVHVYGRRWNLLASGYEAVISDSGGRITSLEDR